MAKKGNSAKQTLAGSPRKAATTEGTVRRIGARERSEQQSEAGLAALTRLHDLSTRLLTVDGLQPLFQEIVDTAVTLVQAERGTLQLLEGESLRIVAHHGHQPPFLESFAAAESRASVCGEALKRGERVIVEDVACSPLFVGTVSAKVLREAGVRAVQSTPLRTRQGKLLGILTTQWSVPHIPDEHDLWQLDLLTRQAADLIEHKQANEDLRAQTEQLQTAVNMLETKQQELEELYAELEDRERNLEVQAETLRVSEERLALAVSGTRIGIYEWNVVTGESLWTEQVAKLLGLDVTASSRPHPYRDWADRIHPEDRARVEARVRRCMAERTPHESEYRIVWPDGSVHWVVSRGVFEYGSDGCCTRLLGMIMDVTERRQSEEALRESEFHLARAQEIAHLGGWSWDLVADRLYWSDEVYRLYGLRPGEAVPRHEAFLRFIHPEDRARVEQRVQEGLAQGGPCQLDFRIVRPGGEERYVHCEAHTLLDAQGHPLRAEGVLQDITDRKRSEEALRIKESAIASSLNAIAMADPQGHLTYVNPAFLKLWGYEDENEVLGRSVLDFWKEPEQAMVVMRAIQNGQGWVGELVAVTRDGTHLSLYLSASTVRNEAGALTCMMASFLDITARKRAEEALREGEERLRQRVEEVETLMKVAPVAIWVSQDPQCDGIIGNQMADRFYEAHESENVSANVSAARRFFRSGRELAPEELPMQAAAARNVDIRNSELDVLLPSGKWLNMLGSASPLCDVAGQVRGCIGAFVDITDRKQAEAALRELNATLESRVAQRTAELERERQRLYAVLEAIPAMVCLLTPDYHVAFANRSFREKFGESHGRHCYEFCFGRTEPCDFCETYNVLKTGKPHRWEVISRDGRTIIDAHDFPFTDVDGSPLILEMDLDITERKRAEAALQALNETLTQRTAESERRARQLQKLTLELTRAEERERRRLAVILHEDLQQQMAGAKFHLNLVQGKVKDDRLRADLEEAEEILKGAIEQSRSLSRDLSPAVVNMNDLAEVLQWLAHRMRAQQGLTVTLLVSGDMRLHSEGLALFLFRAAQEMLFNVVKHAEVRAAAVRLRRIGRYVCLSISDQGCGFDRRELKETSGVGLFSIRERAELLGGRMKVRSAQGQGSKFRLTVPDSSEDRRQRTEDGAQRAEDGRRAEDRAPSSVLGSPSPVLRVLLVDDHEVVREGLAALLREAPGVALVGAAPDGRAAINLALDLRPDVVIMDVSMPLMSGAEATRQIKTCLPQTRVIALSMYDEAEKKQKMFEAGAEGYILKTVSAEELLAALRGPGYDS